MQIRKASLFLPLSLSVLHSMPRKHDERRLTSTQLHPSVSQRRRCGDDGRGAPVDEAGAVEGHHASDAAHVVVTMLLMLMLLDSTSRGR